MKHLDNSLAVWAVILIIMVFLFHGDPDVTDAVVAFLFSLGG